MRARPEAESAFALLLVDSRMPEMDGFELVAEIKRDPQLGAPPIMMLSSVDLLAADRERRAGLSCYVVKPVMAASLLRAILQVLGKAASVPTRIHGTSESGRALRVLLAEDNVVNQKLATRLLETARALVAVVAPARRLSKLLPRIVRRHSDGCPDA